MTPVKSYVILNDLQLPFGDWDVINLVLDFVAEIKPYGVVMNGDVVDCYALSVFDKNPIHRDTLQKEIDEAGYVMTRLSRVAQWATWVGGNHEDRLRRYVWQNPAFAGVAALDFPQLFRLDDYGFDWLPYGQSVDIGNLMLTHGSLVRKHAGATAKAHFEKYGVSVMVGHSHRLGEYKHRDRRGTHGAWENGCLCRLDPEYDPFPDWQQGFSVVHVADDGMFNVQQIPIHDRQLFFYGGETYTRPAPHAARAARRGKKAA